jgi:hypothetical protein
MKSVYNFEELKALTTKYLMKKMKENSNIIIDNHEVIANVGVGGSILNVAHDIVKDEYYCGVIKSCGKYQYFLKIIKLDKYLKNETVDTEIMKLYHDNQDIHSLYFKNKNEFELHCSRIKMNEFIKTVEKEMVVPRGTEMNEKLKKYIHNREWIEIRNQSLVVKRKIEDKNFVEMGYMNKQPIKTYYVVEYVYMNRIKELRIN